MTEDIPKIKKKIDLGTIAFAKIKKLEARIDVLEKRYLKLQEVGSDSKD